MPKRRAAIGQNNARHIGKLWIKAHVVEVQKLGVLLLKLQGGLFPRFHLLQFAAQVVVLGCKLLVGLKIADKVRNARHGGHRPFKRRHNAVDNSGAEPFHPRAINAPDQENTQERKDDQPDQQSADRAEIVFGFAVFGQVRPLRLAIVVDDVAQLLFVLKRLTCAQSHAIQARLRPK